LFLLNSTASLLFMRIKPTEYKRIRSWLGYMAPKVFSADLLNCESDPVTVLDQISLKSLAKARSGLGMAVGDIVDFTSDWPETRIVQCNNELSHRGLPTLTQMQARFSKVVQRVVRRGLIKTDEEFYALRSAAEQPGQDEVDLWLLLDAYEAQAASRRPLSGTTS
jgi:hypothetical protein